MTSSVTTTANIEHGARQKTVIGWRQPGMGAAQRDCGKYEVKAILGWSGAQLELRQNATPDRELAY